MESEHSDIFWVELITKNVVLGSSGTHFMHMRAKLHKKAIYVYFDKGFVKNFMKKLSFIIQIFKIHFKM